MLEGATPIVSSVSYNVAGQITAMTRQYQWDTESRTYNPRGQLTRQTGFGVDISYTFSSTANDGRIQEREDHISGEKVLYQYDQLGRLLSAATEGAGGWGLAWVFDGYGNLRQQNVTKGSLTGFSFSINASTNRINGQTYDANGNWTAQWPMHQTYDIENRISAVTGNQSQQNESYLYSGRNERMVVTRGTENGLKRLHFYGADGLLLGVYRLEIAEQTVHSFPVRLPDQERLYFGGRLMQIGGEWVATDRLGSVVRKGTTNYKYAPYGQEIGGATANDTNKFATYTRDSLSGLDYALNRYYKPEWGRFTSPDPYQASGGPADPGSWNRYAYVGGDPVNSNDPEGLQSFSASGTWDGLPGRFEVSNVDCLTRVHMGFNSVAFCASAGGWIAQSTSHVRGGTYDRIRPSYLRIEEDCYVEGSLRPGGRAQRNVTYVLYNQSGSRTYGFTIREHLTGDLPISGASSPGPGDSSFADQHSVLGGKRIQQVMQIFTATNVALGYLDIPVFVRGFKNGDGLPTDYRVLAIYKTPSYIKINNDYGGTFDASGNFTPNKICD